MEALFFWIFAIAVIAFGLTVVLSRSPLACAVSLVAAFLCLGSLLVVLEEFFLAVAQIIVYAGAVMVLFLFIIMLLDIKFEAKRAVPWFYILIISLLGLCFGAVFIPVLFYFKPGEALLQWGSSQWGDHARMVGRLLYTKYLLPFFTTSVLLLLSTIGVILLSKRDIK